VRHRGALGKVDVEIRTPARPGDARSSERTNDE
jgi:hypothetical protein